MTVSTISIQQALSQALSQFNEGKLAEAEHICREIVSANFNVFRAHDLLAMTQMKQGRYDAALASCDRALNLQPAYALGHSRRGYVLQRLKRFGEAVQSYDRAIALRPDFAEAHSDRGNALQALSEHAKALASYDRAVSLRPGFAVAHYNRGNSLQELKRFDDAVASYDRAIGLRPDFAEAHSNRGNALQQLNRYEEAVASYDQAVLARPTYAEAYTNRGAALSELRRHEEALASYKLATSILPSYADAHFNAALCRLLIGDFDRGWSEYESRWNTPQLLATRRHFTQPLWDGTSDIAGKTILLYFEQGFGDTIQFCRYVPLVTKLGADVILQVQDSLTELMTGLTATKAVPASSPLPDFDLQCPLLSLPLAFNTRLNTIPSEVPKLHISSDTLANWKARLGSTSHPRIGLVWSGLPTHINDRNRSVPLQLLEPLLNVDATLVSLQKELRPEDAKILRQRNDVLHFGDFLKDFSETAALIANLDLVISVDTSVAHLAATLGKPVWLMLPFTPDWRWLLDRADSPWYPTVRLYRQSVAREWESVIGSILSELREFVKSHD